MRDYTSNNITWDLSLRLRTQPTQNKYKKIVVLKLMLLLIEANHVQSIERRIFISRPVETTDLGIYANKMFKNDCFIDLEVGKLCLSFLFAVIFENMFTSYVFPDRNQKPYIAYESYANYQASGGHFVTNFR